MVGKRGASPEVDVGLGNVRGRDVGEDEVAEGLAILVEPANHNDLLASVIPDTIETLSNTD